MCKFANVLMFSNGWCIGDREVVVDGAEGRLVSAFGGAGRVLMRAVLHIRYDLYQIGLAIYDMEKTLCYIGSDISFYCSPICYIGSSISYFGYSICDIASPISYIDGSICDIGGSICDIDASI